MKLRLAACLIASSLLGCSKLDLRLQSPEEQRRENVSEALRGDEGHSALVGDYVSVTGLNMVVLDGVGLVVGLDQTGDDPPASLYRTQLLDEMRRREVPDPNTVLRDLSTTLVLVRAYLPPLIKKGETFDVEVRTADGSEVSSLRGGTLLECSLTEQAFVAGRGTLKGHQLAIARGAVLTAGDGGDKSQSALRRGVVPAGATYVGADRNLAIRLRPDYQSVRMSNRIANRIGQRFHDYDQYGIKRPLAEAKTDSRIELIVHERYRDNYPRYLQCVRHILLRDTTVERHMRMQELRDELLSGPTAEKASLELEAIGVDAIPVLKEGLASESLEVRFHAALALAYLGQSPAAPVLGEAAEKEPAFRIFALAGLAALHNGEAALELRKLLDSESMETRYGAVRALSTIDENDPAIAGAKSDNGFSLRVVNSRTRPMVHVTQRQRAEVTVFGAQQEFLGPMVVSAGRKFIVKVAPGRSIATISHFRKGADVERRQVPARVADVLLALTEMDATYPDVMQMLVEAERQHNLTGAVGIDALPRPGRTYERLASHDSPGESTQIGSDGLAPNLFDTATPEVSTELTAEERSELIDPAEQAKAGTDGGAADGVEESADAGDELGPVSLLVK